MLDEFRKFLLRGNVVDLAVAVVVGAAFGAVVASLVEDVLTPLIALVFGEPDFGALRFELGDAEFRYGEFLNSVFTFVTVAAAIFFAVVKPLNVLEERRRRGQEPDAEPTEVELLTEIRDALRAR